MQSAKEVAAIHANGEKSKDKNSKTVFCDGKRDSKCDQKKFSPPRAKQQMRQNHRGDHQDHARANAAALGGYFEGEVWNVDEQAALCHRDASKNKNRTSGCRRTVLQETDDCIQNEARKRHQPEQKKKRE